MNTNPDSTHHNEGGKVEGAEKPSKSQKPHKFHRVVIQLPHTPRNTKAIKALMLAIPRQLGKIEGRGCCFKHEVMEIKELFMAQEPTLPEPPEI